ncbi:hypothetical protein BJ742DRAFT_871881 [Cladochytrium replicatum]|nr:hypothetical protein BJ742DRAFT_871881 [Cladochytrium replicatum]
MAKRVLTPLTGDLIWENKLKDIGFGESSIALEPSTSPLPLQTKSDSDSANPLIPIEGYVFVACNGKVRAVRLDDGADLWEFKTEWSNNVSLPALLVEDGVLYSGGNRRVYAIGAYKGHQLWATSIPYPANNLHNLATMRSSTLLRPARFDPSQSQSYEPHKKSPLHDCIFVGARGYITPISRQDGSPVVYDDNRSAEITLKGAGYVHVDTVVLPSSGTAVVGAGAVLKRIKLVDGQTVWENPLKGFGIGNVAVVVGGGIRLPGAKGEGESLPAYSVESSSSSSSSSAATTWHDRVFVAVNGMVYAVKVSDGQTIWKYAPSMLDRARKPAHLLADGDGNLFLAINGTVTCLRSETGDQMWKSKSAHGSFAIMASYETGNGETNRHCSFMSIIRQQNDE